jgi:signal transduction histidine kinase
MIVEDVFKDERFFDNPALTGDPAAVFYAGVPLVNPEGYALGSLCVIDTEVRRLTEEQVRHLKVVANQVVKQLELRRKLVELSATQVALEQKNDELEASNEELTRFASIVSHDLKSPLNTISALSDMMKEEYQAVLDDLGLEQLELMKECTLELSEMVVGIYEYSRWGGYFKEKREQVELSKILEKTVKLLSPPQDVTIDFAEKLPTVFTFKIALEQIFSNLINNAIKYNDKPQGKIKITYAESETHHVFQVIDNGQGVPEAKKLQIFDIFQTLGKTDRFNEKGTGIGLAIVLQLVKKMNGEIEVTSEVGKGSTFQFSIKKHS